MRRLLIALAGLGVAAAVAIGLAQTGGTSAPGPTRFDPAAARRALAGAPPELARLHAQANRLLPGGTSAIQARLRELRGRPVVVNKWASWCGPCRFEFPFFQSQGVKLGRRVAFVGLNSGDNAAAATKFLRQFPVPYPSYEDRGERAARALGAGSYYPITIFYDPAGRRAYVHQGGYATEAKLAQDIGRYALGA